MSNIVLKQIDGGSVLPKDDAILYDMLCGQSGIIHGCGFTWQGSNQIHVDSGYGIIKGRIFEITEHVLRAQLPTSAQGTCNGYVTIMVDLENTESPISINTKISTGAITNWTQDDNANFVNGIFTILVATYTASATGIINFSDVKKMVYGSYETMKTFEKWESNESENKIIDSELLKKRILTFQNVAVNQSLWKSDSTFEDYPYRAKIPCKNVDTNYVPYVTMDAAQIIEGIYAPLAQTENGYVDMYAMEAPTQDITIPCIQCIRKVG